MCTERKATGLFVLASFLFATMGKTEPASESVVPVAYTSSESSAEPARPRSLARDFAARAHNVVNVDKTFRPKFLHLVSLDK